MSGLEILQMIILLKVYSFLSEKFAKDKLETIIDKITVVSAYFMVFIEAIKLLLNMYISKQGA